MAGENGFFRPGNPFELGLQMLTQGMNVVTQQNAARLQLQEQRIAEADAFNRQNQAAQDLQQGQFAQEELTKRHDALLSAMSQLPNDDPRRAQYQQALDSLNTGFGLQGREASKFIAELNNVPIQGAEEGQQLSFLNVYSQALRAGEEGRQAREDAIVEKSTTQQLRLIDREGEIKTALQADELTFRGAEGDKDRAFQDSLAAAERAWRSGETSLDRALQTEMQRRGFEFEGDQAQLTRDLQEKLQQAGFTQEQIMQGNLFEQQTTLQDSSQAHEINVIERTQAFQANESQLMRAFTAQQNSANRALELDLQSRGFRFQGEQQDAEFAFQKALLQAKQNHDKDMFSFQKALELELQANGFVFTGSENEKNRALQTVLQENGFEFESSQNQLNRDLQVTLQANGFEFSGTQNQMDRALRVALQESAQLFEGGERSLDRALQERLQANGFVFTGNENQLNRALQLSMQTNDQVWQGNQNALNRGLELQLQQAGFTFQGNENAKKRAFDRSMQNAVLRAEKENLTLRQAFELELQANGFEFEGTMQEKRQAFDLLYQENQFTFTAAENLATRNFQADESLKERNLRSSMFYDNLQFEGDMADKQFAFEELMQDARIRADQDNLQFSSAIQLLMQERGFKFEGDLFELKRQLDLELQSNDLAAKDGTMNKSSAAAEMQWLYENAEDSSNWTASFVDAGQRAGFAPASAQVIADVTLSRLRNQPPRALTAEEMKQIQFEFESELEGIQTQYSACLSNDVATQSQCDREGFNEAMSDWNTRRQVLNQSLLNENTPVGAQSQPFQLGINTVDSLSRQQRRQEMAAFQSQFPDAADIESDEAFQAEFTAWLEGKMFGTDYAFGDGMAATGLTPFGEPDVNFWGQANDALRYEIGNDPEFQKVLAQLQHGTFFEKGQVMLGGAVNDIADRYDVNANVVKRLLARPGSIPKGPSRGSAVLDNEGTTITAPNATQSNAAFSRVGARITTTPFDIYGDDVPQFAGQRHKGFDIVFGDSGDPDNNGREFTNFFNAPLTILNTGVSPSLGNYMTVQVEGSPYTLSLGHLFTLDGLEAGGRIAPGQALGRQGNTGVSTAPHIDIQVLGESNPESIDKIMHDLIAPRGPAITTSLNLGNN